MAPPEKRRFFAEVQSHSRISANKLPVPPTKEISVLYYYFPWSFFLIDSYQGKAS